jgi:hypothetical protein
VYLAARLTSPLCRHPIERERGDLREGRAFSSRRRLCSTPAQSSAVVSALTATSLGCHRAKAAATGPPTPRSKSMQMRVSRRIMGLADASVEDDGRARASPGRSLERFLGPVQQVEERRAPRVSHGDEDDSIAFADDLDLAARESKCLRDADRLAAAVHEDSRAVGCWHESKTSQRYIFSQACTGASVPEVLRLVAQVVWMS